MKIFLFLLGLTLTCCNNDVDTNYDDEYSPLDFENNFEQTDPQPEMVEGYEEANVSVPNTTVPNSDMPNVNVSKLDEFIFNHTLEIILMGTFVVATIVVLGLVCVVLEIRACRMQFQEEIVLNIFKPRTMQSV